jgi:hypothetical protein
MMSNPGMVKKNLLQLHNCFTLAEKPRITASKSKLPPSTCWRKIKAIDLTCDLPASTSTSVRFCGDSIGQYPKNLKLLKNKVVHK